MALIVITIADDAAGEVQVAVQCEPYIDPRAPQSMLTGAQVAALNMLSATSADIKEDRGLIALIN